jgi:hypothetical protein
MGLLARYHVTLDDHYHPAQLTERGHRDITGQALEEVFMVFVVFLLVIRILPTVPQSHFCSRSVLAKVLPTVNVLRSWDDGCTKNPKSDTLLSFKWGEHRWWMTFPSSRPTLPIAYHTKFG